MTTPRHGADTVRQRSGAGKPPAGGVRVLARRYHLIAPLGRGTMGVVWEAYDLAVHRKVAVKEVVLPADMSDHDRAVSRERAQREARAISALAHPNVISFYDLVEEDGHPWVVMELVNSRSLADVIRSDGPLQLQRIATLALAILGALEAAHRAGITHRDVKPSNILLTDDGRVKLTDFGIARTAGDSPITGAGMLVGSPSYIPPEVIQGGEAGPPADMWGLGATLYAAVEARAPFDAGDPMGTLHAVVSDPTPSTGRAGPLAPVIDGLLQKDPRRRLDTVKARHHLLDALRAFDRERASGGPASGETPAVTPAVPDQQVNGALPVNGTSPGLGNAIPAAGTAGTGIAGAGIAGAGIIGAGAAGLAGEAARPWHIDPQSGRAESESTPASEYGPADDGMEDTGPLPAVTDPYPGEPDNYSNAEASNAAPYEPESGTLSGFTPFIPVDEDESDHVNGTEPVNGINGSRPVNGRFSGTVRISGVPSARPAEPSVNGHAEPDPGATGAMDLGALLHDLSAADVADGPAVDLQPKSAEQPAADYDAPPYLRAVPEPSAITDIDPATLPREEDTAVIPFTSTPAEKPVEKPKRKYAHPLAHLEGFDPDAADHLDVDDDFGNEPWRTHRSPMHSGPTPAIPPMPSGPNLAVPPPLHSGPTQAIPPLPSGQTPAVPPRYSGQTPAVPPRYSGQTPAVGPTRSPHPQPRPHPPRRHFEDDGGLAALDLGGSRSDHTAQMPRLFDEPPRIETTKSGGAGRVIGILLAIVVLCIAGYGGYWLTQRLTHHGHAVGAAHTGSTVSNTGDATNHRSTTPPSKAAHSVSYTTYNGDGYSVAVPVGWTADPQNTGVVDFNDAHGDRFIRFVSNVENGGDLVAGFQSAESQFASGHQAYQRVGIAQVDYRGYPAADWEFTYDRTSGGTPGMRHVLYRSFTVNGKTYGIYISAPTALYRQTLPEFDQAAKTFAVH